MDSALMPIGRISRPHGVRGEMKVRLYFEGSDALSHVDTLLLRNEKGVEKNFPVEAVRGAAKAPILALVGIESREGAESLRDYEIIVPRSALPPLAPGEYYLVDLVGCEVFVAERRLGVVTSVRPDPSVDTMIIELSDGTVVEQPILDHFVARVSIPEKRVELANDDGLIQ